MDTVKVQGLFDQISGLQLQVRVIDSEYTEVANELAELAKRKKELAKEEKNWASRTGPLSDQIAEAMAQIQQLVVRNADNEISLPSGKITWKKSKARETFCVTPTQTEIEEKI